MTKKSEEVNEITEEIANEEIKPVKKKTTRGRKPKKASESEAVTVSEEETEEPPALSEKLELKLSELRSKASKTGTLSAKDLTELNQLGMDQDELDKFREEMDASDVALEISDEELLPIDEDHVPDSEELSETRLQIFRGSGSRRYSADVSAEMISDAGSRKTSSAPTSCTTFSSTISCATALTPKRFSS